LLERGGNRHLSPPIGGARGKKSKHCYPSFLGGGKEKHSTPPYTRVGRGKEERFNFGCPSNTEALQGRKRNPFRKRKKRGEKTKKKVISEEGTNLLLTPGRKEWIIDD